VPYTDLQRQPEHYNPLILLASPTGFEPVLPT